MVPGYSENVVARESCAPLFAAMAAWRAGMMSLLSEGKEEGEEGGEEGGWRMEVAVWRREWKRGVRADGGVWMRRMVMWWIWAVSVRSVMRRWRDVSQDARSVLVLFNGERRSAVRHASVCVS